MGCFDSFLIRFSFELFLGVWFIFLVGIFSLVVLRSVNGADDEFREEVRRGKGENSEEREKDNQEREKE